MTSPLENLSGPGKSLQPEHEGIVADLITACRAVVTKLDALPAMDKT